MVKYFERGEGFGFFVNVWCVVLFGWLFLVCCVCYRLLLSVRLKFKMKWKRYIVFFIVSFVINSISWLLSLRCILVCMIIIIKRYLFWLEFCYYCIVFFSYYKFFVIFDIMEFWELVLYNFFLFKGFCVGDYSVLRRCVNFKGVEIEMSDRRGSKFVKRKNW